MMNSNFEYLNNVSSLHLRRRGNRPEWINVADDSYIRTPRQEHLSTGVRMH